MKTIENHRVENPWDSYGIGRIPNGCGLWNLFLTDWDGLMTIPEHGQRNLTMAERSLEISMATVLTESAQNILKNKMCSNGSLEFTKTTPISIYRSTSLQANCSQQKKTRCSPRTRIQSRKNTFVKQIRYLRSLVFFPLLPYQCPVDCGMWNGVECKVWSVKKVESWVGNVVCRVWSGHCGV